VPGQLLDSEDSAIAGRLRAATLGDRDELSLGGELVCTFGEFLKERVPDLVPGTATGGEQVPDGVASDSHSDRDSPIPRAGLPARAGAASKRQPKRSAASQNKQRSSARLLDIVIAARAETALLGRPIWKGILARQMHTKIFVY
jgi:hypothetical protein